MKQNEPVKLLSDQQLVILAINNIKASILAAMVDEALLHSMLVTIKDNDQALTLQHSLTQTKDSITVLSDKLKILETKYNASEISKN